MSGLAVFIRLMARPGQETALAGAIAEVLEDSRAEPGCLSIEAFRSLAQPRLFLIHSRWMDEAAFDGHAQQPHTVRFLAAAAALTEGGADVTRSRPLGF